jgi:hypothetical protein
MNDGRSAETLAGMPTAQNREVKLDRRRLQPRRGRWRQTAVRRHIRAAPASARTDIGASLPSVMASFSALRSLTRASAGIAQPLFKPEDQSKEAFRFIRKVNPIPLAYLQQAESQRPEKQIRRQKPELSGEFSHCRSFPFTLNLARIWFVLWSNRSSIPRARVLQKSSGSPVSPARRAESLRATA